MTYFAYSRNSSIVRHRFEIALILFWLCGLLTGSIICLFLEPSVSLLMRSAVFQPVSIVGLFVSVFLPLICSYLSFLTNNRIAVLLVCFLKAAAYAFSGVMMSLCFGSASWLFRFLFLFSDNCFLVILCFLWFQCGDRLSPLSSKDFLVCTVFGLLFVSVDYFVISPFLMGLF